MKGSDPRSVEATAKIIVEKYTDDGLLAPNDDQWNRRFSNIPSQFNSKNHKHYRQFFDKQFKAKQPVMMKPKREMDPYEQNEYKGTRMPDYSVMSKDRDIYGELGWIPNFNVKCSKDNTHLHSTVREYFDGPKNWHMTFNNSTMTNSEFFRKNAPNTSVAKERVKTLNVFNKSQFGSTMRSTTSSFQTSVYATPFILDRDVTNKHRVNKEVEKAGKDGNIPFLRVNDYDYKRSLSRSPRRRTFSNGFGGAKTER